VRLAPPLDFLLGAAFDARVDAYLRRKLAKSVPSLYNDLKPLLVPESRKLATVKHLITQYFDYLHSDRRVSTDDEPS